MVVKSFAPHLYISFVILHTKCAGGWCMKLTALPGARWTVAFSTALADEGFKKYADVPPFEFDRVMVGAGSFSVRVSLFF